MAIQKLSDVEHAFQEICNALLLLPRQLHTHTHAHTHTHTHTQVQTFRGQDVQSHVMHQHTADYVMAYSIDEIH